MAIQRISPLPTVQQCWFIRLLFFLFSCQQVWGFAFRTLPSSIAISVQQPQHTQQQQHCKRLLAKKDTDETTEEKIEDFLNLNAKETFPEAQIVDLSLMPHKPLGLTVEESLADSNYVFVTKIVEGGNADKAGLQIGDVLTGVTGLFGDMIPAIGLGVGKVKGMVGSRPENEVLEIQVARGTNVMDEHEEAVVEYCSNDTGDEEIEQCVVDYISSDYVDMDSKPKSTTGESEEEECDTDADDADCLVDNLLDMWNEDLPPVPPTQSIEGDPIANSKGKIKPWSSRSSPSGTYVRDPVTGEMKNID